MGNLNEWLKPPLVWLILGLGMILLEFANPGVVLVFFGIGAWIVALVCIFVDISINTQLILFLISSVLLLVILRKWLKGLFHIGRSTDQPERESFDAYFGKKAIVTRAIQPGLKGKIEFQGTYWDAESDEAIPTGNTVEIVDKQNITFTVRPL